MLEIGSLVDDKYKILSKIGQGGMSVVYMAINEKANKTWAVKEVRKDGVLDFEAVKQGLVAETDILKKLSHPNLPSIIDVIDTEDSFIIIMDYVQGNSLNKALAESGAQPQDDVIEWAKQLCDVLGYLHTRQPPIIYRDMKPSNIMLKPDGNIALIDFGTAREFKEKNLADTTCLGTVGYAAPEQFGGMGQTDARTDIYCLGATLYHLVTGQNPSEPPYEIKPIRQINPALSSGLERIIQKCTQRNPDDRYQSAAELMYALEHYEEIDETHVRKQKRKMGGFIAVAALTLVFALTGIITSRTAKSMASSTYDAIMERAENTSDYNTKVELYKSCIAIPGQAGRKDAYLGLIRAFREDQTFTVEEANTLDQLISNNRGAFKSNQGDYAEVCFQTGTTYWYYYDYGGNNQLTRATSARVWFKNVMSNPAASSDNRGRATAYAGVGDFYASSTDLQFIVEGAEKGTGIHAQLFDDLSDLLNTVGSDDTQASFIRLELAELCRDTVAKNASNLRRDSKTRQELDGMLDQIQGILQDIQDAGDLTDAMQVKLNETVQNLQDARNKVNGAYNAKEG